MQESYSQDTLLESRTTNVVKRCLSLNKVEVYMYSESKSRLQHKSTVSFYFDQQECFSKLKVRLSGTHILGEKSVSTAILPHPVYALYLYQL